MGATRRRAIRRAWLAPLLGLCACGAWAGGGQDAADALGPEWIAIETARLDEQRGGFVLPSGLRVSFGFERLVHVNGELVSALRISIPDVGRMSAEEAAQLASLARTQLVQVGPGNAVAGDLAGLVVQNTLDGQRIQVQTTLDAGVGTLGMLQAFNATRTLDDAAQGAVGGL